MSIYQSKKYLNTDRLMAYVEQMKYVNSGDRILEFGGGARVFAYMANQVGTCQVADIDPDTHPDLIVDILDGYALDPLRNTCDIVFCCQVLEHLPFAEFSKALSNIAKLNARTICISVPDNRRALRFSLRSNFFNYTKVISLPRSGKEITSKNHPSHHWEIYSANVADVISRVRAMAGYRLETHYRLFERKYQHFFILQKM